MNTSIIFFLLELFIFIKADDDCIKKEKLKCTGRPYFNVTLMAYYADYSSDISSDYLDMKDNKLSNLQDYIDGRANYVTAAMDIIPSLPYGSSICIPELNKHYRRQIKIQVRDYSVDLKGQGFKVVDICVRSEGDSYDKAVNRLVTIYI
ncbi:hypothetical protein HCN44_005292 [Aphidius gifuensis]|uniref:Odorant-binding protein n=1 Tax=Aphidius gifuensis TaxID=684658 RepID=A0A834Y2V6_APHGI|nr:hypothetical protein HCN44_005292 [Aphidius gifuensis]